MAATAVQANNVQKPGKSDKLTTDSRNALPDKDFAGPDRSYPVEDRTHAINAKARALEMYRRGTISEAEYDKIVAKADAVLNEGAEKTDAE